MTNVTHLPEVEFYLRERDSQSQAENPFDWKVRKTSEIFSDKTAIVVGIPGAFTPTCSSNHIPRYEALYSSFTDEGIDEIFCTSVNDAFVMRRWALSLDITAVKMLPDGNGALARRLGMLVGKENLGFGMRSWRYSMLVKDGAVTKVFVEPGIEDSAGGDPFEVSDADTMLSYLRGETPGEVSGPTVEFQG